MVGHSLYCIYNIHPHIFKYRLPKKFLYGGFNVFMCPALPSRISIPAGPLYSRIVVEAESRLRIRPTRHLGTWLGHEMKGHINGTKRAVQTLYGFQMLQFFMTETL